MRLQEVIRLVLLAVIRKYSGTVEGATHFLMKHLPKVTTEMALHVLGL